MSISLTKEEITTLTNKACSLLYNAQPDESNVLVFHENGSSLTPELLTGEQCNGKSDLFPRGTDPSDEIYVHLATLYGKPGIFT